MLKQVHGVSGSSVAAILCAVGTGLFLAGCASPGPPRPPSLHLPALATGVSARRVGNKVLLSWTSPEATSDGMPIRGGMTAELCREVGARPQTPTARQGACVAVGRAPVSPGRSEMTDELPSRISAGAAVLLTYRVRLFNAAGRTAGESAEAGFAVGGEAPPAIDDLRIANREDGAVLEWSRRAGAAGMTVELDRVDLSAPKKDKAKAAGGKKRAGGIGGSRSQASANDEDAASSNETALRVEEGTGGSSAGAVDQTVQLGERYEYRAERIQRVTLGVHSLEIRSAASNAVELARVDTFPPAMPTGLAGIAELGAAETYVDLSWEPNGEADLAGYLVFRRTAGSEGMGERLNEGLLAAPAFRDRKAVSGGVYEYRVIAVDRSGNQSPASEAVKVSVTP